MSHSLFFSLNVENIVSIHIIPKTVEASSFWRPWTDWMSRNIYYISLFKYVHVHTRMKRKPNPSVKGKHILKTCISSVQTYYKYLIEQSLNLFWFFFFPVPWKSYAVTEASNQGRTWRTGRLGPLVYGAMNISSLPPLPWILLNVAKGFLAFITQMKKVDFFVCLFACGLV